MLSYSAAQMAGLKKQEQPSELAKMLADVESLKQEDGWAALRPHLGHLNCLGESPKADVYADCKIRLGIALHRHAAVNDGPSVSRQRDEFSSVKRILAHR